MGRIHLGLCIYNGLCRILQPVLHTLLSVSHTLQRVCKWTARLDYDNGGEGRVL